MASKIDKYKEPSVGFLDIEAIATSAVNKEKKVKIEYIEIKPGVAFLKMVRHLPKPVLINQAGNLMSSEEMVFRVVIVGKKISEYDIDIQVGDLVQVDGDVFPVYHNMNTIAVLKDNEAEDMFGYYVCKLSSITSKISYTKIETKE